MMWWKSNLFAILANAKVAVVKMEMPVRLEENELDIILEVYEK